MNFLKSYYSLLVVLLFSFLAWWGAKSFHKIESLPLKTNDSKVSEKMDRNLEKAKKLFVESSKTDSLRNRYTGLLLEEFNTTILGATKGDYYKRNPYYANTGAIKVEPQCDKAYLKCHRECNERIDKLDQPRKNCDQLERVANDTKVSCEQTKAACVESRYDFKRLDSNLASLSSYIKTKDSKEDIFQLGITIIYILGMAFYTHHLKSEGQLPPSKRVEIIMGIFITGIIPLLKLLAW